MVCLRRAFSVVAVPIGICRIWRRNQAQIGEAMIWEMPGPSREERGAIQEDGFAPIGQVCCLFTGRGTLCRYGIATGGDTRYAHYAYLFFFVPGAFAAPFGANFFWRLGYAVARFKAPERTCARNVFNEQRNLAAASWGVRSSLMVYASPAGAGRHHAALDRAWIR